MQRERGCRARPETMSRLPAPPQGVRRLDALRVLSLRHLAGARTPALAAPACFVGDGPRLLWRSPTEQWWIGDAGDAQGDAWLAAHAPGTDALAYAVDQSHGVIGFEFDSQAWRQALPRLVDASAIPRVPGQGVRARLVDVAVTLLRISDRHLWLLADRTLEPYLLAWFDSALQGQP
jgi:sarcosine oxidase gamma subunit